MVLYRPLKIKMKKTSRQIQAEETKTIIISAARELLKEKSFSEIKITEICERANTSVGNFYHHLTNKAGIIVELYKEVDVYFYNELLPKYLAYDDAIEAIIDYTSEQCNYAKVIGLDLTIHIYKAQIDNGNTFFLNNERGLPHGLFELVEKAYNKNLLKKDADISQIQSEILIMARGIIYYWVTSSGNFEITNLSKVMVRNYLKAYLN